MKYIILTLCLLSLCLKYGLAQDTHFSPPSMVEPSPEAFNLGKFGYLNSDLYTGVPEISVPLLDFEFEDLTIPLKLNYYMPGLRPREEASWVGLGWSLNSHAVISRTVVGQDDLFGTGLGWIYLDDLLASSNPPSIGAGDWILPLSTESLISFTADPCLLPDTEQDLYVLNLFGKTLKFIMGKFNPPYDKIQCTVLNDRTHKVEISESSKNFTIIDGNGYKYEFNNKLTSQYYPSGCGNNQIMTWNISKIISPYGTELIFGYAFSNPALLRSCKSRTESAAKETCRYGTNSIQYPIGLVSDNYTEYEEQYLSYISSPNSKISFITSNREDLLSINTNNPRKLDRIELHHKYQNGSSAYQYELKKTIWLKNSYFRADKLNASDKEKYLRLRLDAVKIQDRIYNFEYFGNDSQNPLPNKETFSMDYWGYFNGKSHNSLRPPYYQAPLNYCSGGQVSGTKREADAAFSKWGVLRKMTYPTSGYSEFEYEGHEVKMKDADIYQWESSSPLAPSGIFRNKNVGGLRIKSLSDFDINNNLLSKKEYEYYDATTSLSYGLLMIEDFQYVTFHKAYECINNTQSGTLCSGVDYFMVKSEPLSPLRSISGGSHLGYSKVKEKIYNVNTGQFYLNEFDFINAPMVKGMSFSAHACPLHLTNPNSSFRITTSATRPSRLYSNNFKNGKRLEEKYFDETGILQKSIIYNYQTSLAGYSTNMSYILGYGCNTSTININLYQVYSHEIKSHLLTSISEKEYFDNDFQQVTTNLNYDSYWRTKKESTNLASNQLVIETYYLNDYQAGIISNDNVLKAINIINRVINRREILNGTLLSGEANKYNANGLLSESYSYYSEIPELANTHQNNVEIPIKYQKEFDLYYYPGTNKPQELIPKNSAIKTYIWGLGNSELMAKVTGLSYSAVLSLHPIDYSVLNGSTNQLARKTELQNLSTAILNSGHKIEVADYDPLIGMQWKKGESGKENFYKYDTSGRLKSINNTYNSALKGFYYHFSNTNY